MSPSSQRSVLTLNGTTLEGGGGLVRYAIIYSSIFNRPIHIHSIRATRPGVGGLRPEHTVAIAIISDLTSARVTGNLPASRDMTFTPHVSHDAPSTLPSHKVDVPVEGSASIFLIAMLPYILFSQLASKTYHFRPQFDEKREIELVIRAGTLCVKAPSIFYMRQVFAPTLKLIGIGKEHFSLGPEHEQGWHTDNNKYPGKMVAHVKPLTEPLPSFILDRRGLVRSIQVTAHVPKHTLELFKATLQLEMANAILSDSGLELIVDVLESVPDDQYHLLMVATTAEPKAYLGYEQVYPQRDVFPREIEGKDEEIAIHLIRSCIYGLWAELRRGHAVDEHMEDFLALYQSLSTGFSAVTVKGNERPVPELSMESPALKYGNMYEIDTGSMHRETSWWIVEQFTGLRPETKSLNGRDHVGCAGIGLGQ